MSRNRPQDRGAFDGFPDSAFEFWEGLEADNSKTYWQRNKALYESDVKAPVAALAGLLSNEFGEVHVFRPYRDVRFSKDKTPYQLFTGMACGGTTDGGSLYVQIGIDGMLVAGGYYRPTTSTLTRFRDAISDPVVAGEFDGQRAQLTVGGYTLDGDELKTVPKGWDRGHPRLDLLRLRNLAFSKSEPRGAWLSSPECLRRLEEGWRELDRWNEWLFATIGPPDDTPS